MNIVTLGSNIQLEIIDNLLADNVDQFIQSISSLEDFNFQFILDLRFPYKLPPILNSGPSLLSLAAFLGAEKCVHHLLNLSINLDLKDHEKRKAVHFACAGGNINICRELDSYGCKFDNSEVDSSKQSPVHYACAFGSLEVCQWLWTHGEKFSSLSCGGHSPYGDAAYHGQLELLKFLTNNVGTLSSKTQINDLLVQASLGGHSHVLEFLFDVYADYDRLENDFFIDTVRSGSISSVKIAFKWIRKLLTRNSTKNSKRTPHSNQNDNIILIIKEGMKVAVNNSYFDIVNFLLKESEKLSIRYEGDCNLLKTAILSGNEEIFDYLLEKLSPVDLTTKQFILENAAKTGLPKLIQKIYELWPNDVVFNFDVIKATIESQNIEAIEYLFKNGADINLINDKIFSNMHNYSILFYLIRRGAKFEFSPTNKAFVNLIKNAKVNDLKFCIQKGAKITQEHIEMSQCLLLKKTLQSIPLMTLIFDNNPDLSEKSFLIREMTYIALNSGTKYRKLLQRAIDLNAKIDKLSVKNAVQRKGLPILKMFVKNGVRLSGHKLLKFFNTDQDLPSLKELLTDYSQISDYDNFMNDAQVYSADQSIIDYLNEWKESFNTNN